MPTIYLTNLRAEGHAVALEALRDDPAWRSEPWSAMFSLGVTGETATGVLEFRYDEDYKRPGPLVADLAARHPELTLVREYVDEFVQVAVRETYRGGKLAETDDD